MEQQASTPNTTHSNLSLRWGKLLMLLGVLLAAWYSALCITIAEQISDADALFNQQSIRFQGAEDAETLYAQARSDSQIAESLMSFPERYEALVNGIKDRWFENHSHLTIEIMSWATRLATLGSCRRPWQIKEYAALWPGFAQALILVFVGGFLWWHGREKLAVPTPEEKERA
jgi:hypothetical protein